MRTKKKLRSRDGLVALAILGPMLVWWIVIAGFPTLFGLLLGFLKWKGLAAAPTWNGFQNFVYFFKDPLYVQAFWRAIWLGVLCTFLTMALSFLVAMLLNMRIKARGALRTAWYIPTVTSVAAISQILMILIDPKYGAVNDLLAKLGLGAIDVSSSYGAGVFMIVLYSVWRGIGGTMLLWIAGLQSIDRAQYEAAQIDGANGWNQFRFVTLPGLKPFMTYAVITGAIGAIQLYEPVAFITGGGPLSQTETLVFLIMRDAFYDFNFGMAGASSVIMTLVVFVFAIFYLRSQARDLFSNPNKRRR